MDQAEARRRAKEISEERGIIAIADTVRPSPHGKGWIRGGWASQKDEIWVVAEYGSNIVLEGV